MAKKKGMKGGKSAKSNAMVPPNYVTRAAGFNTGGAVAALATGGAIGAVAKPMKRASGGAISGMAAHKRLDRPGRKRGGAIGADTAPLTTANKLSISDANKV